MSKVELQEKSISLYSLLWMAVYDDLNHVLDIAKQEGIQFEKDAVVAMVRANIGEEEAEIVEIKWPLISDKHDAVSLSDVMAQVFNNLQRFDLATINKLKEACVTGKGNDLPDVVPLLENDKLFIRFQQPLSSDFVDSMKTYVFVLGKPIDVTDRVFDKGLLTLTLDTLKSPGFEEQTYDIAVGFNQDSHVIGIFLSRSFNAAVSSVNLELETTTKLAEVMPEVSEVNPAKSPDSETLTDIKGYEAWATGLFGQDFRDAIRDRFEEYKTALTSLFDSDRYALNLYYGSAATHDETSFTIGEIGGEWSLTREAIPGSQYQIIKFRCHEEFRDLYEGREVTVKIGEKIFNLGEVLYGVASTEIPANVDMSESVIIHVGKIIGDPL